MVAAQRIQSSDNAGLMPEIKLGGTHLEVQ